MYFLRATCRGGRGGSVWLLMLVLALSAGLLATPVRSAEFATRAKHAILMDADTGAVLFERAANVPVPPASMSKLMTLAVVFRALKDGRLKPEDEFLISENAWRTGGAPSRTSAMLIPINTKVRLDQLLQGIIVQSGNDACIAIAEGMAGSEAAFAKIMETEARRIGLKTARFGNSTGLPHPDNLVSMRELAMLGRFLMRTYPDYYKYFAQKEFVYRRHRFINRNPLLFLDIGADGLKTGFLSESGYGVVGSAKQGTRRLIVAMNGLATKEDRKTEARKLLEWGFRSFSEFKIFDAGEVVGQALVWGGERMYVPLTGNGDIKILLPRFNLKQTLSASIVYQSPLKAPIKKGDQIAVLRVVTSAQATNEVPLYAAEDVPAGGFMRKGLHSLLHLAFKWVL